MKQFAARRGAPPPAAGEPPAQRPPPRAGPSLYDVLGLSRSASAADIKKRYRDLARKRHPATRPDPRAEDQCRELHAAYEVLSDVGEREAYDREFS